MQSDEPHRRTSAESVIWQGRRNCGSDLLTIEGLSPRSGCPLRLFRAIPADGPYWRPSGGLLICVKYEVVSTTDEKKSARRFDEGQKRFRDMSMWQLRKCPVAVSIPRQTAWIMDCMLRMGGGERGQPSQDNLRLKQARISQLHRFTIWLTLAGHSFNFAFFLLSRVRFIRRKSAVGAGRIRIGRI